MAIFQCSDCGSADNTALAWHHSRNNARLTKPDAIGKSLCSACAPNEYPNGEKTKFNGKWHGQFKRIFLPHGEFKTNGVGNLEHIESGLVGNEAYDKYGRDTEYHRVLMSEGE